MVLRIGIFIIFVLSLHACQKPGCLDPSSTNYNPAATKDDGSCHYLSDEFVGEYIVTDTTWAWIPFQANNPQITYSTWPLSIYKLNATQVKLSIQCNNLDLVGTVATATRLTTDPCASASARIFTKQPDNTLIYSYSINAGASYSTRGKVVRK